MADIKKLLGLDELELIVRAFPWESDSIPPELRRLRQYYGNEAKLYALPINKYKSLRRAAVRGFRKWMRMQYNLHQLICIKFDYCRHREQQVAEIARQLSDFLAQLIPSPYSDAIAVLLVKIDLLDGYCRCNLEKA